MEKIVIATNNKGKIKEIQAILAGLSVEVLSLQNLGKEIGEPEETGSTFEENALLKASYYAVASELAVLADDSGLEIEALDGRPGVFSARYVEGSDEERCAKVLQELEGVTDRRARFVCVVAYADPIRDVEQTFQGLVEGTIAPEPKGSLGFGYDPIFIPHGHTQTFGELGDQVKNTISHRARALQKFKNWYVKAAEN